MNDQYEASRLSPPPATRSRSPLLSALMSGSYLMCMVIALSCYPGFIASQAFNLISGLGLEGAIDGTEAWYLTIPFWEWMVMFGITTAFVVMGLRLKDSPGSSPR